MFQGKWIANNPGGHDMDFPFCAIIADPNPEMRQSIIDQLSPSFKCIPAQFLFEVDTIIRDTLPDLILLEREQTDGDVLEFIRRLRAHPHTNKIVIVCLTHQATISDKVATFQCGADQYLIKPLHPDICSHLLLAVRVGHQDAVHPQSLLEFVL
jgi:DNA-binding response OmpR family regulator